MPDPLPAVRITPLPINPTPAPRLITSVRKITTRLLTAKYEFRPHTPPTPSNGPGRKHGLLQKKEGGWRVKIPGVRWWREWLGQQTTGWVLDALGEKRSEWELLLEICALAGCSLMIGFLLGRWIYRPVVIVEEVMSPNHLVTDSSSEKGDNENSTWWEGQDGEEREQKYQAKERSERRGTQSFALDHIPLYHQVKTQYHSRTHDGAFIRKALTFSQIYIQHVEPTIPFVFTWFGIAVAGLTIIWTLPFLRWDNNDGEEEGEVVTPTLDININTNTLFALIWLVVYSAFWLLSCQMVACAYYRRYHHGTVSLAREQEVKAVLEWQLEKYGWGSGWLVRWARYWLLRSTDGGCGVGSVVGDGEEVDPKGSVGDGARDDGDDETRDLIAEHMVEEEEDASSVQLLEDLAASVDSSMSARNGDATVNRVGTRGRGKRTGRKTKTW